MREFQLSIKTPDVKENSRIQGLSRADSGEEEDCAEWDMIIMRSKDIGSVLEAS